ncbi:ly6/PLAUR domain-containing protein 2-like [Engystomops pustulosus]|uniref:ly6/PLAUR domain-containing protein 2-like n=1 Tax=Engystomops pustulosus TaxID=76066 RepID=UPI003AFA78EF
MRGLICIGIIATCLDLASSLRCFVCLTPTPSNECLVRKTCSPHHTWCMTTVYGPTSSGFPFMGSRYVVRTCTEKCNPTNLNILGVTKPVYCCKEDFCNTMNGTEIPSHGLMGAQSSYYTVTAAVCSLLTALQVTS